MRGLLESMGLDPEKMRAEGEEAARRLERIERGMSFLLILMQKLHPAEFSRAKEEMTREKKTGPSTK